MATYQEFLKSKRNVVRRVACANLRDAECRRLGQGDLFGGDNAQ